MTSTSINLERLSSLRRWSALCAFVGGVVSAGLGLWRPSAFWPAYLVAVLLVLGSGLGCLAVALLHRLTGGRWGMSVLRELTAAVGTIPFATLLLLPIVWGASYLYPWLGAEQSAPVLNAHQREYFAPPFWIGRAVIYVVVWTGLGLFVGRGYRLTCRTNDPAAWTLQQRMSAVGLVLLWLTLTFASMDWLMSLEPDWTSTIYGAMVTMGFVVGGWSMAIILHHWLVDSLRPDVSQDLGNMLLAFLLVWVYLAFSQFLIIWSADLPDEISWYQHRSAGVWGILGSLLLVFHFVVPFGLLLSREQKRDLQRLAWLATGLLVMRAIDLTWIILPAIDDTTHLWIVLVPTTVTAVGGAWLWVFLRQWRSLPELPAPLIESAVVENDGVRAAQEAS